MKTKNTRKGFTTVELVIVIAVIAILATVLIPTFSNMINQANLSADTQNVRNMNTVLMTYITDGEPEHFGVVRDRLIEGGYKTGTEFIPKTAGYRYLWYSVDNKILLVNDKNEVVYPEGYEDLSKQEDTEYYDTGYLATYNGERITTVTNVYKCFDLSLPAALIEKETNATAAIGTGHHELFYDGKAEYGLEGVFAYFDKVNDGLMTADSLDGLIAQVAAVDPDAAEILKEAKTHLGDYCEKVNAITANAELDDDQKALEKKKVQASIVQKVVGQPLAVKYTFTADEATDTKYDDWQATFFVSVDMADCTGNGCQCRQSGDQQQYHKVSLNLAGFYEQFCLITKYNEIKGDWVMCRLTDRKEGENDDLLRIMGVGELGMSYWEIRDTVGVFECGVLDVPGDADAGTEMTVELRLTNRENPEEIKVVGVFRYTFQ